MGIIKRKTRVSQKALSFTESVIREMTREAILYNATNLGQGFPDFAAPSDIKRKAQEAIEEDYNQYAVTWGTQDFREAVAEKTYNFLGFEVNPQTEITVTCGSTEGMIATMLACVDACEEVILFEPFYENYAPDAILSDAKPVYVPLESTNSGWKFDHVKLRAAFNHNTKAIIICTPNHPTGKVFAREELEYIAALCVEFDVLCFTDEIYEHIIYPAESETREHFSMAQIESMRNRTVVVNSL
ncbi:MAG: pyridoxal phosphate-dependent aminotransferase, partial [Pyrinomonadaceae bacterium]